MLTVIESPQHRPVKLEQSDDIPLNLSHGRRKQGKASISRLVDLSGRSETEPYGNCTSPSKSETPKVLCKSEHKEVCAGNDFLGTPAKNQELTNGNFSNDCSSRDALCTPNSEAAAAVSSFAGSLEYGEIQSKVSVRRDVKPNNESHFGTPSFPLQSDIAPTNIETGSDITFESGNFYISSNCASSTPQVAQTYQGMAGIPGITSGHWTQSSMFAREQIIMPTLSSNYSSLYQPDVHNYNSTTPALGASWPWMVAVNPNFYTYRTNLGETIPTDPGLIAALPMTVMQATNAEAVSYSVKDGITNDFTQSQLGIVNSGAHPSAFHVISRVPVVSSAADFVTHGCTQPQQEHTTQTPVKSNRKERIKRVLVRRKKSSTFEQTDQLLGALETGSTNFMPDSDQQQEQSWENNNFTQAMKQSVVDDNSNFHWSIQPDANQETGTDEEGKDLNQKKYHEKASGSSARSSTCLRSRPLNRTALKQMRQWYEAHIDRPYPTTAEKIQLARLGGIKVSQVNSWFANQRTRSCNTRPKKKMQRMQLRHKELAIELEQLTQGLVSAAELEMRLNSIVEEYLS